MIPDTRILPKFLIKIMAGLAITVGLPKVMQYFGLPFGEYANKHVPNVQETAINTLPTSAVEFFGAQALESFGDHPQSKAFIRDILKLIGGIGNVYLGTELGGSGYKYTEIHIYAQLFKVACKGSIIVGGFYLGFDGYLKGISRVANVVCEPIPQLLIIAGKHREDNNATDIPITKYIMQNLDRDWIKIALTNTASKTIIAEGISSIIHSSNIKKESREELVSWQEGYGYTFLNNVGENTNTWKKIESISPDSVCQSKVGLILSDASMKIPMDMAMSFLYIPPIKMAQNLYQPDKQPPITNKTYLLYGVDVDTDQPLYGIENTNNSTSIIGQNTDYDMSHGEL